MAVDETLLYPYLSKIQGRGPLSQVARAAFLKLPIEYETYDIYHDIFKEGCRPTRSCLIIEGIASRYKTLRNGARQINSFHLAGDMVDLHAGLPTVADGGVRTHTEATIVTIACDDILDLAAKYPEWGRAFWFDTLVEASIFREWTVCLGRRNAVARVAHLLLEFSVRFEMTGHGDGRSFILPITQADIADAVGLSAVHTNRSIQHLRQSGEISTDGRTVTIEDYAALEKVALFDPAYLHLGGPRR